MTVLRVFLHSILLSCYTVFQRAGTSSDITCVGSIGMIPTTFDVAFKNISSFSGLYLNTDSMSTCNGTVIAWNYCYYVIQGTNRQLTKIQAGVWRRKEMGYYQLLNNSLTGIPISPLHSGLQFACLEWYLNFDKRFDVQEGDIVGLHAENKSGVIHFLGMPTSNAQYNGTWKADNVTTISPVSDSELNITPYSLYLMAVIGDPLKVLSPSETTTGEFPDPSSGLGETTTAYYIMAGLGVFILLLLLIITVIVCKLCCICIHRRKETGPVLVRYGNGRLNWTVPVLQNPVTGTHDSIENSSDGTQTPLPQPSHQHAILPPMTMATSPLQLEPREATSPGISQLPAVLTVVFDNEQMTDDQDKVLVDPKSQHPTNKRVSLLSPSLPKSDIKRSCSENEILKSLHTHDTDDCEAASTEYPYVLHAFEVIGKQQASVGSVPKMLEHHTPLKNSHSLNLHSNKQGHPNAIGYVNFTESTHYYEDSTDDLSYSYVDQKTMVQSATSMLPRTRHDQDDNHTSQTCDEYPSTWTPSSQRDLGFVNPTTKSKLLASAMDDHDHHKYAFLQRSDTDMSLDSERAHPEEWSKHTCKY